MFCPGCGSNLGGANVKFCPNCGTAIPQVNNDLNNQAAPQPQPQPQYPPQYAPQPDPNYYQAPPYTNGYGAPVYANPMYAQPTPMKWFKFLIYFALFAGAVLNFGSAMMYMTGAHYMSDGYNLSKLVYSVYEELKVVDVFMGICCLALAAYGIYVRFQLSAYKKNSGALIVSMYLITAVLNVIYVFAVMAIVGSSELGTATSSVAGTAVGGGAMAIANYFYFKKRAHIFVR